MFEVNAVDSERKWVNIAIDSAAAGSVCPKEWAEEFKAKPCAAGAEFC